MAIVVTFAANGGNGNIVYTITGAPGGTRTVSKDNSIQDLINFIDSIAAAAGAPTGPAGGDLQGTYPNPTIIDGVILLDSVGSTSANFASRSLLNSIGSTTIDWGNEMLADSAGGESIDWNQRFLFDSTGNESANWVARLLLDTAQQTSIDWANRNLCDSTATPLSGIIKQSGAGWVVAIAGTDYLAPSGQTLTVVTGTTQAAAVNQRYAPNNAALCTVTLPATAAVGSSVELIGLGAGGWRLAQNAGQIVHLNSSATTSGAGGSLSSTNQWNAVRVICLVANTTWVVSSSSGTLTVI